MKQYLSSLMLGLALWAILPAQAQVYRASTAKARIPNSQLIRLNSQTSEINFIRMDPATNTAATRPEAWLKNSLKASEMHDFSLRHTHTDPLGYTHLKYEQTYKGIPIEGANYTVHTYQNSIRSANGDFYNKINVDVSPRISKTMAIQNANSRAGKNTIDELSFSDQESSTKLVILPKDDSYHLAYKVDVFTHQPLRRAWYFIDAKDGSLLETYDRIHTTDTEGTAQTRYRGEQTITTTKVNNNLYRLRETGRGGGIQTYNLQNSTDYNSAVDFTDSDNVWDNVVNEDDVAYDAHWGTEKTYDYFKDVHGRNSYDNQGAVLLSYIHYSSNYANAFWNGTAMTYGDGNSSYSAFTSLDIVAHEITHGVTEYSAGLIYRNESGALNESFSDIFGVVIDFYADPSRANYKMGEQPDRNGRGIRNMEDPKSYGDPDTYGGTYWYTGTGDNGGVHTNSGVQNYWFYLLVNGGSGSNDHGDSYHVTGIGMDKAAKIAYRNLAVYLSANSTYEDARFYAIQAAEDLYGACSAEVIATTNAWHAVGVGDIFTNIVSADFIASQTFNCETPVSIQFTHQSTNASSFLWDFGDGNTSTDPNPTHTFDSAGIFSVSLIVTGSAECNEADTIIKENYIHVSDIGGTIPVICKPFSISPSGAYGIHSFKFHTLQNTTSNATEGYQDFSCSHSATVKTGRIYPMEIELGDEMPHHVRMWIDYNNDGQFNNEKELVYEATDLTGLIVDSILIASDVTLDTLIRMRIGVDEGSNSLQTACTSPDKGQFEDYAITIQANESAPEVNFAISPTFIKAGEQATFTDLTQNTPTSWQWSFPGGSPSTSQLQNPSVTYPLSGLFPVTLSASNEYGTDTLTKSSFVIVTDTYTLCTDDSALSPIGILYDQGGAEEPYSPNTICNFLIKAPCGDSLSLVFTSFDLGYYSYMRIYDGQDSDAQLLREIRRTTMPAPVVSSTGEMYIRFVASSSSGKGFEAYWHSNVEASEGEPPMAAFSVSDTFPMLAVPVQFTDSSQGEPTSWYWDFGNGETSQLQNPTHLFQTSGSHTVRLVTSNCFGLDTTVQTIQVQEAPRVSWSPESLSVDLNKCSDSVTVPLSFHNKGEGPMLITTKTQFSGEQTSHKEFRTYNAITDHSFTNIPASVDSLHLSIRLKGGYTSSAARAYLIIEGIDLGQIAMQRTSDFTVDIPIKDSRLPNWLSDGELLVSIENNDYVGNVGSHTVTITYEQTGWLIPQQNELLIPAGDSANMDILFNADGLISRVHETNLAIRTNDPLQRFILVPATLNLDAPAVLSLSDSCLDFGNVVRSVEETKTFDISNEGCDSLHIHIQSTSPAYSLRDSMFTLLPNDSKTIQVAFLPDSIGPFPGELHIQHNGMDTIVCLSGEGLPAPHIFVTPESLNEEIAGCEDTVTTSFQIFNPGESSLDFEIPIIPQQVEKLEILAFADGINSSQYNSIKTAIQQNFANYNLSQVSSRNPETLRIALQEKHVLLIPPLSSSTDPSFFTSLAPVLQEFVNQGGSIIFMGNRYNQNRSIFNSGLFTGSYGGSISNSSTQLIIQEPDHPIVAGLSSVTARWYTIFMRITNEDYREVVNYRNNNGIFSVIGYRNIGSGRAIHFGYDFNSISSTHTASKMLGNTLEWCRDEQKAPLVKITPDDGSIAPGDTLEISVQIYPDGLLSGTYRPKIRIQSNDPLEPEVIIPATITLVGEPIVNLSKDCMEYDALNLGFEQRDTVWISNTGCTDLEISRAYVDHTSFSIISSPDNIEPGDTATIIVSFKPQDVGIQEGVLRLNSQIGTTNICLKGEGLPLPEIAFSDESPELTFSICKDSTLVPITIYNHGEGELNYYFDPNFGSYDRTSYIKFTQYGEATTHRFNNVANRFDSLIVTVTLNGEFQYSGYDATLKIDEETLGVIPDGNLPNGTDIVVTYRFGRDRFENWLRDEALTIIVDNSSNVAPRNGTDNSHKVQVITIGNNGPSIRPNSANIPAGDSLEAFIFVDATDLEVGRHESEIFIPYNHPDAPAVLPFTLRLIDDPIISLSDSCLDFGSLSLAEEASKELFIFNQGCKTLVVENIVLDEGVYSISHSAFEIAPNNFEKVTVSLKGETAGTFSGNLYIISNVGGAEVCLNGSVTGESGVTFEPSFYDVEVDACGEIEQSPLFIYNHGSADLTLEIENDLPDWLSVSHELDTIAPGAYSTIMLEFSSENLVTDTYEDILSIQTNSHSTSSIEIPVKLTVSDQPCANFSFETEGQCDGEVQFVDESSDNATMWIWNFGDGQSSTSQHPSHTYATSGMYTVTLIAANSQGADVKVQMVYVPEFSGAPCAKFVATPTVSCDGLVNFTDLTGGSPTMWIWDFGDGNISTDQHPAHTYAAAGTYRVRLFVVTSFGTDFIEQDIQVGIIQASIGLSGNLVVGDTLQLQSQAADANSWLWSFGDGMVSDQPDPTHVYLEPGVYEIELMVENELGCSATSNRQVEIQPNTQSRLASPDGDTQESFNVFPNPTQGSINITYEGKSEVSKIVVFNAFGQIAYEKAITNHELNAPISLPSTLANGTYFVKLVTRQHVLGKTLILRR